MHRVRNRIRNRTENRVSPMISNRCRIISTILNRVAIAFWIKIRVITVTREITRSMRGIRIKL